jgi:diguanylate cyclase (GGDEF)-like protein/putative nucleotidyltransferase with HDIG domain
MVRRSGSTWERKGWLLLGAGIAAWGLGDIYYSVAFYSTPEAEIPFPSPADVGYLAFYPPVLVGLALLVRAQLVRFARSLWLDALIAGLTVTALATALVLHPVMDATSGDFAVVATNLAYPVGDVVLIGLVVGFAALARRRLSTSWLLIAGGLGLFAVSDSIYLVLVSNGTYVDGTVLDLGWLLAMVLLVLASVTRSAPLSRAQTAEEAFVPVVPATLALFNISLDIWDHFRRIDTLALILSGLALVGVVMRMMLSMRDNRVMLRASRTEAITDPLTGLHNRRKLQGDLLEAVEPTDETTETPLRHVLLLFDLDGFKGYNDSFGHPAGDALLVRLATNLAGVAHAAGGRAYRLGGDEFCLLVPTQASGAPATTSDFDVLEICAAEALAEDGEGFAIRSSCGAVVIPDETDSASEALRIADSRMYEEKNSRPTAGKQSMDVLLSALEERDPDLADHTSNVSRLATAVAESFDLGPDEVESIRLAAQLHDIGKIAIPDSILAKPGPLDDSEWAFMKRHTIIGERITAAAPSLRDVADIIRSSHERWDGRGYPDGLSGQAIPLGARIVFACDAMDAMTSSRPYHDAITMEEALTELRRSAGSQFDPDVVERLVHCARASVREPRPAAA